MKTPRASPFRLGLLALPLIAVVIVALAFAWGASSAEATSETGMGPTIEQVTHDVGIPEIGIDGTGTALQPDAAVTDCVTTSDCTSISVNLAVPVPRQPQEQFGDALRDDPGHQQGGSGTEFFIVTDGTADTAIKSGATIDVGPGSDGAAGYDALIPTTGQGPLSDFLATLIVVAAIAIVLFATRMRHAVFDAGPLTGSHGDSGQRFKYRLQHGTRDEQPGLPMVIIEGVRHGLQMLLSRSGDQQGPGHGAHTKRREDLGTHDIAGDLPTEHPTTGPPSHDRREGH